MSPDESRWHALLQRRLETEITRAFDLLREHNIEPLLIKGWAAARNYPKDVTRRFSDIDLAVAHKDFRDAQKLLTDGYRTSIGFDVHDELRHLDRLSWSELVGRADLVEIDGCQVRIPCAEDHLRIMAVHWLTDGGANKERLLDIKYAVENRSKDFDWDKCLNASGHNRRTWVLCTIGLASMHYDLKLEGLPFEREALEIPRWLTRALDKEWQSEVKLKSLNSQFENTAELLQQIRKRIPPNSVQATIDMEGPFDERCRVPYQLGSIIKRIPSSVSRIFRTKVISK